VLDADALSDSQIGPGPGAGSRIEDRADGAISTRPRARAVPEATIDSTPGVLSTVETLVGGKLAEEVAGNNCCSISLKRSDQRRRTLQAGASSSKP